MLPPDSLMSHSDKLDLAALSLILILKITYIHKYRSLIFAYQVYSLKLLTLCILMNFPIKMNAIRMGLSIIYLRGCRLEFPNYDAFKSWSAYSG